MVQRSLSLFDEKLDKKFDEKQGSELVKSFRSNLLEHGPGNLSVSSKEAKKRFNHAGNLMFQLSNEMDDLIRAALYRSMHAVEAGVSAKAEMEWNKKTFLKEVDGRDKKLKNLAVIVLRALLLQKTGGWSCDDSSASLFLHLAEHYGDQEIIIGRYEPTSTEDVQPPEGFPGHRIVLIRTNQKDTYALDAWWPGGKVEKLNQNDNYDKYLSYPKLESVARWKNKDKDFVEALRDELEIAYGKVESQFSKEDASEEVESYWTIKE
jgi:hypothetical protein